MMYENVQKMVLGKIQDVKGSPYTDTCFLFFFGVKDKRHNASGG